MKPYDWMVKYTAQTEWIKKQGVIFWLAFFFIELGAGTFLVSSVFSNTPGEVVGWLICGVLGGGLHFLYLGRPFRFYRMVLRPQTSWISRGLLFVLVFLVLALIHFWKPFPPSLLVVINIFAFMTIIYGGFAMSYVNAIPLWNSSLLPVLFTIGGLWGGAEISLAVLLASRGFVETAVKVDGLVKILLSVFLLVFPMYLMAARYGLEAGRVSIAQMVKGSSWPIFWGVVVLLGLAFPAVVVLYISKVGLSAIPVQLLYAAIALELLGDLMLRYLILKNGFYSPLIHVRDHGI